ncbi:MAG: SUMF1/EgtB/PvdO family nonheme iron enzyme [Gammaproteobacteria bacterium]|nr:SUMF1/EgtB/PvdO family nonheme iron enzyme [Gammaproteobacteria bacterium]
MTDDLQTLTAGHRLGDYEVRRVLGSGTFGNVYLCLDQNSATVAVREYMPHGLAVRSDDLQVRAVSPAAEAAFRAGLERFVGRARRMMSVEHPNVVRILGVLEANGTAGVAMDYVEGRPLAVLLPPGGTLSSAELASRIRPVAEGLAAMHGAGTAHGSLGLGSIFVREDGSSVLLGLAVSAQDEFGAVRMPGYAPIEHYSARADLVSSRADAYSLAAVLYRCVTGVVPPEAPIRAERDTLVPAVRAAKGRRAYSPELLEAIDAALTLDPANRPDGVQALLDALVDVPPDRNRGSRRSGPAPEAAARHGRRRRYKVALTTAAVGLVGIVASIFVLQRGDWGTVDERENQPIVSTPSESGAAPRTAQGREPPDASATETVPEEDGPALVDAPAPTPVAPVEVPPPRTASLVVVTQPPGAEVLLDDEPVGVTPFEVDDLAARVYALALRHPHYDTVETELDLSATESTRFERELDRATGALLVTTTPPGAWIEWDGERLADGSPATLADLPAGPITLTLGAPRHVAAELTAVVPKNDTASVAFSLEPALGTLTLLLSPTDADVALLDAETDYRPGVRLAEGPHRVSVSRTGWRTVERTVDVAGDTRHEISLEAQWHPLTVTTNPAGASVALVDGDVAYSPGVLLPPGEYRLEASLLGYAAWQGTVRHSASPTMYAVSLEFVSAEYADPLRSGGNGPEMTVIPAGSFRMGCLSANACAESEQPVRSVTIASPFSMSKHEVTFEHFDRYVRATGRERPDDTGWGRGRRPVINVSWQDANDYASWLSAETGRRYRLPTEAEWEYAARAGTETAYAWGETLEPGDANCTGCGRRSLDRTVATGSFRANAWGLHDMHGNVWEWVEDCWNESYGDAPADGSAWVRGDCGRRPLRGGSWFNSSAFARSAARLSGNATVRGNIAGFRVVVRDE